MRAKVDAVLETIDGVRELDFPYGHAKEAVNFIRNHFEDSQAKLNSIREGAVANNMCRETSKDIDEFLMALGFLVRACDVGGALELQGPLLRLTYRAIGSDIRLVIFSDWRYSPSTLLYPGTFGQRYVLVGLPVSEAGNPLIAPLAGHELGHNIWSRLVRLNKSTANKVKERVKSEILADFWNAYSKQFKLKKRPQLDQQELFGTPAGVATAWAQLQCEEMFCDFIALSIFGVAYLHAFQYLTAPGGGERNPAYPAMTERVDALIRASESLGIEVPVGFKSEFDRSSPSDDPGDQLLLAIADRTSKSLVPELIEAATSFCHKRKISSHTTDEEKRQNAAEEDRIYELFESVVPAVKARSLSNILNAAWRFFLTEDNPWARDYPETEKEPGRRVELLHELTLKSFEVFEIEKLQEEGNATIRARDRKAHRRARRA